MRLKTKRALLRRFLTVPLAVLGALAIGAALEGASGEPGIEGRWEDAKQALVLDVSRCGEKYCGRLVTAGDQCGQTVLTVTPTAKAPSQASEPTFEGDLDLRERPRAQKVSLTIAAGKMRIIGETDPRVLGRSFPFHALLARVGDAHCRPNMMS
jgi:hypothetical protein